MSMFPLKNFARKGLKSIHDGVLTSVISFVSTIQVIDAISPLVWRPIGVQTSQITGNSTVGQAACSG